MEREMHRIQIVGLNDIKLYAKNEQINLCFHWVVRYAKNWAVGKQMKMIASYYFILVDCRSQSALLTYSNWKLSYWIIDAISLCLQWIDFKLRSPVADSNVLLPIFA